MRVYYRTIAALVMVAPAVATTQNTAPPHEITGSVGVLQWDYNGTGISPVGVAALARHFGRLAVVEADAGFSRWSANLIYPATRSVQADCVCGPAVGNPGTTTHITAELAGQLQLPLGSFAPYAGIGGGTVWLARRNGGTATSQWAGTVFGSAGARLLLSQRVALRGELRLRAEDPTRPGRTDFLSNAEYRFGLSRRF